MQLKQLADQYIPRPLETEFFYKDGDTEDIATKVMQVYAQRKSQVKDLAPHLKGQTLQATCYNIWRLIKDNIQYRMDPRGRQWVRRPARLWYDKVGDCKSYSVFAASLLHHLGIKGCFRFVRFKKSGPPTHVYVVVMNNGHEIIIDAVMPGFNIEKPYNQKWDYNMTRISELAGIPRNGQIAGGLSTLLNKGKRREVLNQALPGLAVLALYQFIPAGRNTFSNLLNSQFATSDDLLSTLPEIVKQKRFTSFQSFWDFGDWADIKVENEVFPKVQQILTAQLGMDPFEWWRLQLRRPVANIGFDPVTAVATVGKFLGGIKDALGKLFGGSDIKWKRGDPSTWAPAISDWNGYPVNPLTYVPTAGSAGNNLPVNYVPGPGPSLPSPMPTGGGYVQPPTGGSTQTQVQPKDNTMLYVGIAIAAILFLKK